MVYLVSTYGKTRKSIATKSHNDCKLNVAINIIKYVGKVNLEPMQAAVSPFSMYVIQRVVPH